MLNLVQGDFGQTSSGLSVAEQMAQAWPTTLKLALLAIFFEIIIGITAGVLAGLRRGGFIDNLILVSTLFVVSIPIFVIGFVLQYIVGIRLGWFPATVSADPTLYELILPAFVLGSVSLAYVARLTRTSIVENLRADFVRTALAKGLPRGRIVGVHTLRNSLIPVITYIGVDFGQLLGGAVVTEGIFNVKGVGGLLFTSIRTREGAVVTGVITVLVLIYLLVSLLVDLLYAVLDPRIRYE
jgi:oligopeptide transport system permease protein